MRDKEALHPKELASPILPSQTNPLRRILVVNDNADIRQFSTEVMNRSGYEAHAAASGEAASQTLQTENYDLLITDHEMLNFHGVQSLGKAGAARMAIPIIMTPRVMNVKELPQPPRIPPARMLRMPYTVAEFLAIVAEVLSQRIEGNERRKTGGDSHLRSTQAVNGYHLRAGGQTMGHVCDFIIENPGWMIRELVIKIGHRLTGKEVKIPVGKVERISYEESTVFVNATAEAIEKSPGHDLSPAVATN